MCWDLKEINSVDSAETICGDQEKQEFCCLLSFPCRQIYQINVFASHPAIPDRLVLCTIHLNTLSNFRVKILLQKMTI